MKKAKLLWYLLTIIPIALLILGYIFPSSFFGSQEAIRDFVNQFGIFSPLVFILIQVLQVVVTPFSHYAVSIAGGFIFGTWQGFIYNWIGRVIGTAIAFYLARFFGRKIIKHVVKPETIKKYDYYFDKGKILLFLAYFLPVFPDDEFSYLAGLSAMKPKIFLPLMAIGHVSGSLALAYVGNGIQSVKEPMFIILSLVTLIGGIWFVWHYRKVKNNANNNMETKITYFVHGTTTDNEQKISSGWFDVELSELGAQQSKELWDKIKDKHFDVVFCSDLKRAVHSAELTFKDKVKIIPDKRLRECNYGKYNAQPSEIVEPMQEQNITKRFPDGESHEDVKARISDFLDFLKKNYDGKSVAIVAHKAPQLALDVLLKNKTWEQAFADDWRKTKAWRPGWNYTLE